MTDLGRKRPRSGPGTGRRRAAYQHRGMLPSVPPREPVEASPLEQDA
jgi:hypothetical protein